MSENEFTKKHRNDGIDPQLLSDVHLNPFAIMLLIESYTDRPEEEIIPVDFNFRGIRVRLEKAAEKRGG